MKVYPSDPSANHGTGLDKITEVDVVLCRQLKWIVFLSKRYIKSRKEYTSRRDISTHFPQKRKFLANF